jgi:amino acid transporter
MGLTAITSSATSAAAGAASAATSLLSPVGAGVGGIFVAAALIVRLAYLDFFDASSYVNEQVRNTVLATILPLALTFGVIVIFESLKVV